MEAALSSPGTPRSWYRIALLTPYDGGNLGDAAIQDAMIENIRLRLPNLQCSAISLNCDRFIERHGVEAAFALCGTDRPFYGMSRKRVAEPLAGEGSPDNRGAWASRAKTALKNTPVLGQCLKKARRWVNTGPREIRHFFQGYRFLCTQDLLIVSGGGQLDEEWGGPWGHPFALFKWAVLARLTRIPCAIASVGAGKASSTTSRLFLSAALRMSAYRSYRDKNSRAFAAELLPRAMDDSIVPDPALTLSVSGLASAAGIRARAQGRTIIAISPIVYAKPGAWPHQDRALYGRYLEEMAGVVSQLLKRDYFLVIVWSSEDDQSVIPEVFELLDDESKSRMDQQAYFPAIANWKDHVTCLQDVDFVIASRLHSVIFGLLASKPTIAVSFDPKVDWLVQDVRQADYLLQIRDFTSGAVIETLKRMQLHNDSVRLQIDAYRQEILSISAVQYDTLAELAVASHRRHS